jgi:hypothetical protein
MLTEQNIKLFQKLGLPIYDEDADEKDVPFTDLLEEKTKEEIYSVVRDVATMLQQMGAGPYTLFTFKQQCNSLARKGAQWVSYQGLCCKYVEQQARLAQRQSRYSQKISYRPKDEEPFECGFWGI